MSMSLPKDKIREKLFWILAILVILVLILLGGCTSSSAQQKQINELDNRLTQLNKQVQNNTTGVEGNNNSVETLSSSVTHFEEKVNNITTNVQKSIQDAVTASVNELKGDLDQSQHQNNPWPYVVIISVIIIYLFFDRRFRWFGLKPL